MGCPDIKNIHCEDCCEATFKMLKEALYSKRTLEGGYETDYLTFMSEFIKLIKFNDNHENKLRVEGNFEATFDDSSLIEQIEMQTDVLKNSIRENRNIKNSVQKTILGESSSGFIVHPKTKQIIVNVLNGEGSVGFTNGIKYVFNENTEKVALIYDSNFPIYDATLDIVLSSGGEIEIQEIYEVENV